LNTGEKCGVIKKSGASYSYEKTSLGRGYDNARQFLKDNQKITQEIVKKIKEAVK